MILRALNGHSQNRSLDEEATASRKNYLFDQVRSPYSILVNTSALVPFFFIYFIKDRMSGFKLVEPSVLSFLVLKLFFTGERCFQPKFKYLNLPSSPFFCLKFQFKEVRSPYSVLVNTRPLVPFFLFISSKM